MDLSSCSAFTELFPFLLMKSECFRTLEFSLGTLKKLKYEELHFYILSFSLSLPLPLSLNAESTIKALRMPSNHKDEERAKRYNCGGMVA